MSNKENRIILVKSLIRLALFPAFLGALILWPAGTWDYWQVYAYFGVVFVPMVYFIFYFYKNDPQFLKRRLNTKEQRKTQKFFVLFMALVVLAMYILPGFDKRYSWSEVPLWANIVSLVIVLAGYLFIIWVFKINSFASRVVEVMEGQEVISTGPYAIVRHPMYSGMLIMYAFTPIALDSWWGLLPLVLFPPALIIRILNEEKLLREELKGYEEYTRKVKWRLIPGLW